MPPSCTIVTACYDMTKFHSKCRDIKTSITNMKALCELEIYLVIYTDTIMYPQIEKLRQGMEKYTKFVVREFDLLPASNYVGIVKSNRIKYHPTRDDRTCPESHLLCCSKFDFVLEAIKTNPFETEYFGWIDSNVGPNFSKISRNFSKSMLIEILENCYDDKFHIQVMNYNDKKFIEPQNLNEYYRTYRWVVCGSFFVTKAKVGIKILNYLNFVFMQTTFAGYGHGEEMFYLDALHAHGESFNISYGDYSDILNNWLRQSTNMCYIFHGYAYANFTNRQYRECFECCKKMIASFEPIVLLESPKVQPLAILASTLVPNVRTQHVRESEINYFTFMNFCLIFYRSSLEVCRDQSVAIKTYIRELSQNNSKIREHYDKEKNYYDYLLDN